LESEVDATELYWFLSPFEPEEPDQEYVISQNQGVNGEFYVTAVNGEKESNFSNVVSTVELSAQIPVSLETNIGFNKIRQYSAISEIG
jgi:hypothetical protein